MALDLLNEKGYDLDKQLVSWRELVRMPVSKLDDDAFSKIRIILMNGIELEALRFSHGFARMNRELQLPLAKVRRVEQQQATMINWLLGSDMSPLETTIAYEQVAIEVTAAVAQKEPDSYLAQVYRYGLLEDFDHMYRYSALMDRVEGKDANSILQSYTDIIPGRPTHDHHRAPDDELRNPYAKASAHPLTKFHALTIMAGEQQTHNYYMNIGPTFADPNARQLYAEIASVEEQHVTQYESIIDPTESFLEKWVMHEANEVYNYYSCAQAEKNSRLRSIWERFLDFELAHLQVAIHHFKETERRDPAEILPQSLPDPLEYRSQRQFVRSVLEKEVDLRARGPGFGPKNNESEETLRYRGIVNADGSPSDTVSAGYIWRPGTELARKIA